MSSGCFLHRYEGEIEMVRLTPEVTKLTLAPFSLEPSHAFLDIFLSAREHRVNQSRELMRGRLHRPGRVRAVEDERDGTHR